MPVRVQYSGTGSAARVRLRSGVQFRVFGDVEVSTRTAQPRGSVSPHSQQQGVAAPASIALAPCRRSLPFVPLMVSGDNR